MISPAEIRKKAARRYRDCLKTWLAEGALDSLFPLMIPFRHIKPGDEFTEAGAAVRALREGSKEHTGRGYSVEWREVQSRSFGRNPFPERIVFETPADYLHFIGREEDYAGYTTAATAIRERFPVLRSWLESNIKLTEDIAGEGIADGLLRVCEFLEANPRPGLFGREIPVGVDTKFIERHAGRILRPWLDLILPPDAIRADESQFERRFGLGYVEPLIRVRFLDSALRDHCGFRQDEIALPLRYAAHAVSVPSETTGPTVFVVENLVNALTLPPRENALVLGGLGSSVSLLRYLDWLHECRSIYYWGDVDVQGFEILSQFRTWFPDTQSLLMDEPTMEQFAAFVVPGKPGRSDGPLNLTAEETRLFEKCRRENLRLEQEKIPQAWVEEWMARTGAS